MLKFSHTRLLAAVLGCLAIAAASIALAQEQQSSSQSNQTQLSNQSDQTQPATQSSPPTGLQLDAAGTAQQKSSDQAAQQSSKSNEESSLLKSSSDSQSSADAQKSNASSSQKSSSSGNASRSASSNPEWPAPQRYNPNNPQGGSLGVNIVADGQNITVTRVHSGTPAQQMGLRPRDRIASVNGQSVGSTDQFISIIRNMSAGDQVELGIVRDEGPSTLRGKLESYREALARGPDANAGNEQGGIRRSRGSRNPLADENMNSNRQTSYEERSQSERQPSGDIESRLTNLEQQLSQLRQDVAEIRSSIRSNPTSSTQPPAAIPPAAQGGPRTPSVFPPTPGEPPSVQRSAGQPSR
jgi:hypothetical protein